MKQIFTSVLLLLFSVLTQAQTQWSLVWQDEFNYTGLPDASKWGYDVGGGGWGNGEVQYYNKERLENTRVEGGRLIIEARRDWSGAEYSSARLVSRGKGDWLYGRVEVRAKIPLGQGLWPAIWMLPTDWAYGGWPASGEIDIMESFALGGIKPNKVEANIHTQAYHHSIGTNKGGAITNLSNIEQNYHVYGVSWYPDHMVFDVDGVEYFTFRNEGNWQAWPFDKRFHLIMNIAVGGALGTWVDPNIFPKRMEVDYVRVYQQSPAIQSSTGLITVYKDCNYNGFSGGLGVGDYNLSELQKLGVQNKDISSLKITQGYQAILYDGDNFTGNYTVINTNTSCLNANWNDKTTSIRVTTVGATNLSGVYFLQNKKSNLFLDVTGGTEAQGNGVKLQQWHGTGLSNQQFAFTHLGNGTYRITTINGNRALDVEEVSKNNGAAIHTWGYGGGDNQQFIAVSTGNGYYKLVAKHSGKVIEIAGCSNNPESKVQQWENNNQDCSEWLLIPTTDIVMAYKDCNFLGASSGIGLGDYTTAQLSNLGIANNDISSLKVKEGYKVILYDGDNFTGTNTEITSDNACLNATWNDKVSSIKVLTNGLNNMAGDYLLENKQSKLFLTVNGGVAATGDGVNIIQWNKTGNSNQQFKLIHISNGAYKIRPLNADKRLEIQNHSYANGGNIQQNSNDAAINQEFILVPNGDGYFKLIAKHNAKVIEITSCSSAPQANVQVWDNNGQQCVNWRLVPLNENIGNGTGLQANYFSGRNFETPILNRIDETIDFNWGNGSPDNRINNNDFSVRWTGKLLPKQTGEYTFYFNGDDGRKLWINDVLVINDWKNGDFNSSGKISLKAGEMVNIKIDYYEATSGAKAQLLWATNLLPKEVVPKSQLFPNPLPSVSISYPENNSDFDYLSEINISTTAIDDGNIQLLEIYNGNTKIGEKTSFPWSIDWMNAEIGSHEITARVTDNMGAVGVSNLITINVNLITSNQTILDNQFVVYPNPSTGIFYISTEVNYIEVYNKTGMLILQQNNLDGKINLSEFANGMYLIRLHSQNEIKFQKVIKQNN